MAWQYESLLPTPPPPPALAGRQELGRLWVSCSPLGSTFISGAGSLASGRFLGHNTESPGDTFTITIAPPLAQRGHPSLDSLGCPMTAVLFSVSWACVSNSRFPRSDVRSVGLPGGMPGWDVVSSFLWSEEQKGESFPGCTQVTEPFEGGGGRGTQPVCSLEEECAFL